MLELPAAGRHETSTTASQMRDQWVPAFNTIGDAPRSNERRRHANQYSQLAQQELTLDPTAPLRIAGLADGPSAHPWAMVGDQAYEGTWQRLVGTELVFDADGQYLGAVRLQVLLAPGELKRREWPGNDGVLFAEQAAAYAEAQSSARDATEAAN